MKKFKVKHLKAIKKSHEMVINVSLGLKGLIKEANVISKAYKEFAKQIKGYLKKANKRYPKEKK